jgi:hypothetical protein
VASTCHDVFAHKDYRRLLELGISTAREGLRWHLIERTSGQYDFSSALSILDAAHELGVEQIIDLFHFGWPDHIDALGPGFVDSFGEFAFQFARLLRTRGLMCPLIAPMNEISFLSWAGGDVAYLNPFQRRRGPELKAQLVRAAVRASTAFLSELPSTRLVWPEPVIHIVGDPQQPGDQAAAEAYRLAMFEAWDMISGRIRPELGGQPQLLQIIGVNFYGRNEWINYGKTLNPGDPDYRPFHKILLEVWQRYRVPLFVSETGAEGETRVEWFGIIAAEVRKAITFGAPIQGVCLYPILNHPGWDDDRHCYNGLFDYADQNGERELYEPLAQELSAQQKVNAELYTKEHVSTQN